MKDFLNSVRFKVILALVALFLGTMLYFATSDTTEITPSSAIGVILTPVQTLFSNISDSVSGFVSRITHINDIADENEVLKKEVDDLRKKIVDYDEKSNENNQLRDFLEIKEKNPDIIMESALIIGRSSENINLEFTINKGSSDDISAGDPVITSSGLCGIVTSVGFTYSRVTTIFSESVSVGAFNSRTQETAILSSDTKLSSKGLCELTLLTRDTKTRPGDIVITSGTGGVYPQGLVLGTVTEIIPDDSGLTYCAQVEPAADIETITDVVVITGFAGQGEKLE